MSKNRNRKGATSPLTLIIRILIIVIFVVAVVITINRIGEVNRNDQKRKELASEQALHSASDIISCMHA